MARRRTERGCGDDLPIRHEGAHGSAMGSKKRKLTQDTFDHGFMLLPRPATSRVASVLMLDHRALSVAPAVISPPPLCSAEPKSAIRLRILSDGATIIWSGPCSSLAPEKLGLPVITLSAVIASSSSSPNASYILTQCIAHMLALDVSHARLHKTV